MRNSSTQPSPQTQFYKTFGRPIAKVFLMAIFTYQLVYYVWVRLEHDEIRRGMEGMENCFVRPDQSLKNIIEARRW